MSNVFRVGLTPDYLVNDKLAFKDVGLDLLDAESNIEYKYINKTLPYTPPEAIAELDGLIALGGRYTKETFKGSERLTILARHGVGYDNVDLDAATEANVMVCITPAGVRRPVAEGILTLMLALSKHVIARDKLVRNGGWMEKRLDMCTELREKTLGSIGLGNIASELFRLCVPFGMRFIAYDPYVNEEYASSLDVTLVDLDSLMRESDFVTVNCPLNSETLGMIGERELNLMNESAYFINTARGAIVNQKELTKALKEKRIRGAGLDVLDPEPVEPDDPLLELDNVILSPHGIAWTDEGFRDIGRINCQRMIHLSRGKIPEDVVNKEVLNKPALHKKLEKYRESVKPKT